MTTSDDTTSRDIQVAFVFLSILFPPTRSLSLCGRFIFGSVGSGYGSIDFSGTHMYVYNVYVIT